MKHYSAKNNLFYAGEFYADYKAAGSWPADAVEVSDAVYAEFSRSNPGYRMVAGGDGLPTWEPLPPRTIEALAEDRSQAIQQAYENALGEVAGDYSHVERDGWPEQVADARAHQAGDPAPLVEALAVERGITMDLMAQTILDKRQSYLIAYGRETATMGRLRNEIEAALQAGDRAALEAIAWPEAN